MTFGEKLREVREAAGLTQAGLAAAAGIGLATVRDYEGNRRSPSLEIAQGLAKITGVSCQVFDGCEFRHAIQRMGVEEDVPKRPRGRPRKAEEPSPAEAEDKLRKRTGKKGE
jgi:transcriptional regulator with XRE-family HTH domain